MSGSLTLSDRLWVDPSTSDTIITVTTNVFDHQLLSIDATSPITTIGTISCGTPAQNPTSDPIYVSQLKNCATQMNNFFATRFSDYTSHISHRCHLSYTGPVSAGQTLIDLDNAALIFRHFTIPCSDS